MYNTEVHIGKSWQDMNHAERILFLTAENAYFIWESRMKSGKSGSTEQDWAEASARVQNQWARWV